MLSKTLLKKKDRNIFFDYPRYFYPILHYFFKKYTQIDQILSFLTYGVEQLV